VTPTLLPAVSSEECVRALERGGFHVVSTSTAETTLQKEYRAVTVPHADLLPAETVARVLRQAGLGETELLDMLGHSVARIFVGTSAPR
jgi:predicted RNA binding protein YcfA (HicA-like mRNA interferase family)